MGLFLYSYLASSHWFWGCISLFKYIFTAHTHTQPLYLLLPSTLVPFLFQSFVFFLVNYGGSIDKSKRKFVTSSSYLFPSHISMIGNLILHRLFVTSTESKFDYTLDTTSYSLSPIGPLLNN